MDSSNILARQGHRLRALRELQRRTDGGYVFETERGTPFTTDAVNRLIKRIGGRAGFPFKVHVHMLRHACGYALARHTGQDWLGHRAITKRRSEKATFRYTAYNCIDWETPDELARRLQVRIEAVIGDGPLKK